MDKQASHIEVLYKTWIGQDQDHLQDIWRLCQNAGNANPKQAHFMREIDYEETAVTKIAAAHRSDDEALLWDFESWGRIVL